MHPLEDRTQKLAELVAGLRDFTMGADVRGLDRHTVGKLACLTQEARSLVDGFAGEVTAEATAAGCALSKNLKRAADFVALETTADPKTVNQDNIYGHWARQYPSFHTQVLAGDITRVRLRLLKGCDNSRTREALCRDQQALADAAATCSQKDFESLIEYWKILNDPDGKEPKLQEENRSLTIRKGEGGVTTGTYNFDAIVGHIFTTAIEQEVNRLRLEDEQTGNKRKLEHLRNDAIANIIQRGAARQDGTLPAPLLIIVMGGNTAKETLIRLDPQPGDPEPTPGPIPVSPTDPNWRCELIDGTPIHPYAAFKYMGAANMRRLIVEPETGKPFGPEKIIEWSCNIRPQGPKLNAGRLRQLMQETPSAPMETKARNFTPPMRIAIIAAGRGRCDTTGCNAPHHWLQADHVHPHSKGGPTHLHNGKPLCRPCNLTKSNQLPHEANRPSRK